MSAHLKKEARALAPYGAAALALVFLPYVAGARGAEVSWFSYACGCALFGGVAFGQEFQHGTLALTLTQPIARAVIWRDKMLVLAAALVTLTAASMGLSALFGGGSPVDVPILRYLPLCVLCSAPLLTLVSGSALGGAILSATVPGLCLTIAMIASYLVPALDGMTLAVTLVLVACAVSIVLGYVRFARYQLRAAKSTSLRLPDWLVSDASSPPGSPLVTLLRKELRLQHGTFVLALVLWALFFVGGVVGHAATGEWRKIALVATGIDLLLLPLIAGAIAIGEERSLGIADWQLALPPSARLQWLAKMLVTLPTSLVLGLAVPLLVRRPELTAPILLALVVGHLLLTHLAIYAGSFASGTMTAILVALGFWSAVAVAVLYAPHGAATPAVALALVPALVLLQYFAFTNYRRRGLGVRRIALQCLAIGGLLAIVFPR